jgi:hypothetical protein
MPNYPAFTPDSFFAADDPYTAVRALSRMNENLHSQYTQTVGLLIAICELHGGEVRIPNEVVMRLGPRNIQWEKQENGDFTIRFVDIMG